MKNIKKIALSFLLLCLWLNINAQCNQTLTINGYSADCIASNMSSATLNVTVLFGNGNNSVTISYDMGGGEVVVVILEDDNGDIVDQDYTFQVPSCNDYSVILTAWTNPSGSGTSCSDPAPVVASVAVLPVEFGDFNVLLSNDHVSIEWSTYTETNNDRFAIQRSIDNKTFITIGEIAGAGNSSQKINYNFIDNSISRGTFYYRIKQFDLDGQFSYSVVRNVTLKEESKLMIYPNPANEYISVSSFDDNSFEILNSLGQVVGSYQNISEGDRIDISKFEHGMYFLLSTNSSEVLSFIKL